MAFAKWLVVFATMLVAYAMLSLWKTGHHPWESPPPPKTQKERIVEEKIVADAEEIEYLAAIIRHSFRGSPLEMLLVGLAAKNIAALKGINYQRVFRDAAEMVPPWSKKEMYIRVRLVVMAIGTEGERAAARSLARQIITRQFQEPYASLMQSLPPTQRCVTTYFRPQGNKNPQSEADLKLMKQWEPKAYVSPSNDGAFWLCLPLAKP